jgi:hypothetical protein
VREVCWVSDPHVQGLLVQFCSPGDAIARQAPVWEGLVRTLSATHELLLMTKGWHSDS